MYSSENIIARKGQALTLLGRLSRIRVPSPLVVGALLTGCLFLLRMPSALLPREINVDEGQMLSQGMKFLVDPVPWRAVDGTSSGPLNSYLLSSFLLIGLIPSFVLVHLVANALVCLHVLLAHRTLLRLGSERTAAFGVLPMVLCYGLADGQDYLHYSSELLPVVLVALGFHFFVMWLQDCPNRPRTFQTLLIFLSGLAFGAAPWAKFQALPISGILGLAVLTATVSGKGLSLGASRRVTQTLAFFIGAILPAGIIVWVVAQSGAIRDFWYSYVLSNLAYAGQQKWTTTMLHCVRVLGQSQLRPLFLIDLLAVALFAYGSPGRKDLVSSPRHLWVFGSLLLYAGSALFAVCRPTTSFLHYTVFLLHPMTYLGVGLLSLNLTLLRGRRQPPRKILAIVVAVSIAIMASYVFDGIRYTRYAVERIGELRHPKPDSNERIAAVIQKIRSTRPVGSLEIWGWAPGVYVISGIPPATRDSVGYKVISKGPLQGYYRHRFLSDLRDKMPDLFIDAVAPGAMLWNCQGCPGSPWTESDGYESDGELKRFVDENYALVEKLSLKAGSKPVRFFTRLGTADTR